MKRSKKAAQEFDALAVAEPLLRGTTLLEASAGTGKTYALAAIYLRLLLGHGLAVREILVTTFTKAATAELRTRLRSLLRETHDAFRDGHSEHGFAAAALTHWRPEAEAKRVVLAQALREFDEAAVFTIHGFCQRMLGDRGFESGALGEQRLITDEGELLHEVAADYWRTRFYDCADCLSAAAAFARLSVESLAGTLKFRLQQPSARLIPPASEGDLDQLCCAISAAFQEVQNCWVREEKELRHHFSDGPNAWAKAKHGQPELVQQHLDAVSGCLTRATPVAGHEELAFFSRSQVDKGTRKASQTPPLAFFDRCEELQVHCERFGRAVQLDFLRWAPPRLAERKTRLGVQSYGDLLARLAESLRGPSGGAMTAAIRARFSAALVDEFQDTDPVQDGIFEQLFGKGEAWLFLIGDPKQAIYGFRGADVFTYLGAARRVGPRRTYTLGTNFRSAPQLVGATNALFQQAPKPFVIEEIAFREVASTDRRDGALFSGDEYAAPFRIWHWQGEKGAAPVPQVRQDILTATAAEIARLLAGGGRVGGRAVSPQDIAVLALRNADAHAAQEALARLGVPSVVLQNQSVLKSSSAREMLALLRAVARPADEGLIRGALLTPPLGRSFSEVAALSGDGAEWERTLARFQAWHAAWLSHGFSAMFQRLLREGGVAPRLLGQEGGERSLTNLLHLAELLQKAALEERLGPRGLLRWLEREIRSGSAAAEEHEVRLERDDEAVRIVTVHRSKGLEYPIVFCPIIVPAKKKQRELRFHDPVSHELILDFGSPEAAAHEALAEVEELAEEVRLLYVAVTRAMLRCDIVWGRYGEADKSAAAWLLHPGPEAEELPQFQARVAALSPEEVRANLEELVSASEGAIALHPMPSADAPRYQAPVGAAKAMAARPFRGTIARGYGVSSFSSLTAAHDAELPDYDAPRPEALAPELDTTPEGIHALPGGTRTGICLHEIFEELDFTNDAALEPLVRSKLAAFSLAPVMWGESVAACVRRVLQTRLRDGFRLADIPSEARLSELEFFLPAGRLEAAPLRALMQTEGLDRLDFAAREGWLKGFIDLVVVHGGRYFLFDWKSNRLGDRAAAYTPPTLATAMVAHAYGLQLHLYTVALHRYLRQRVPGYDYEQHFGGAYYIFLRGVEPQHPDWGIVQRRPSAATVAGLEQWLEGAPGSTLP